MDWKIFFTSFLTLFVAELGDKTQFAAMALSSQTRSTWSVFWAAMVAVGLALSLGIIAGKFLGATLTPDRARWVSGGFFLFMGLWILLRKPSM